MGLFSSSEKPGYFKRLKEALKSTSKDLVEKIGRLTSSGSGPITEEALEELEEALLAADIGVQTSHHLLERIREAVAREKEVGTDRIRSMVSDELIGILRAPSSSGRESVEGVPQIWFVVGVNGVGKTTTIGKLARQQKAEGRTVLLAASDTFRAAAIEQLDIWAKRTDSGLIRQNQGADPAAVLYDAIAAGRARSADVIIVDTAGRIHTKSNLMQELEKMRRVAAKEVPGAPHEVFLILDATTGQNGLVQAREFLRASGVTGLIVTKLDGTAKGGILVAIARELAIPIRYIGVGEKVEDLLPFDPEAYVGTLFGASPED